MLFPLPLLVPPARFLDFGGIRWTVRDTREKEEGPGPNRFSADPRDVWVDAKGLHLRAAPRNGVWRCAQVVAEKTLGYGAYQFTLDDSANDLDPNVVLGLFTYDDDPAEGHRELDIEVSRWTNPLNANAQFVVQPFEKLDSVVRFELPALPASVHRFDWLPESVAFSSRTAEGKVLGEHTFASVPKSGKERVQINLWLAGGKPPTNGKPVEVVIRSFRFIPAPAGKKRATGPTVPLGKV